MRPITIDQSLQVMAVLTTNTDWDAVDFETARLKELVIENPREVGRQFIKFLQQGCRMQAGVQKCVPFTIERQMGSITIIQSYKVVAILTTNTKWDDVDFEAARLQELVIENPREAGRQFLQFLQQGCRMQVGVQKFTPWRTIKIGVVKTVAEYRKILEAKGIVIEGYTKTWITEEYLELPFREEEISFVKLSVDQLGYPDGATLEQIFQRAEELGLKLCERGDVLPLRLDYADQPKGEHYFIAHTIFFYSTCGRHTVFTLCRNREDKICIENAPAYHYQKRGGKFVFRLRKELTL